MVSTTAWSLTPTGMSQTFSAPRVDVAQGLAILTNSQDGNSMIGKILIQPGAGPNGTDIVTATVPQEDGSVKGVVFTLNADGYLTGSDPNLYLPMFQPIVDSSGKVIDVKENFGALNAYYNIPACTAIAQDTNRPIKEREAALESCLIDHNVTWIPKPKS